ncbi:MAG: hypothetical protein L6M37_05145 [Candidatus Methylarchaceae archaeon HK02M1]|nr:hypothetical protein [Candidatus Methylarchaceae archaeon HK02M1]
MKFMQRMITRFLPGKMAEGTKLLDEFIALINKKYGPFPSVKKYTPWLGGGNALHTIILEIEWDSLTKMVTFFEKSWADPEVMKTMPEWEKVEESHEVELYMIMP